MSDKKFVIATVPAYQTVDGQRFHDLGEAQTHTRRELFAAIRARACRGNPEFARLDKDLLIDFLMENGSMIGGASREPFNPIPMQRPEAAAPSAVKTPEEVSEQRAAETRMRDMLELKIPPGEGDPDDLARTHGTALGLGERIRAAATGIGR